MMIRINMAGLKHGVILGIPIAGILFAFPALKENEYALIMLSPAVLAYGLWDELTAGVPSQRPRLILPVWLIGLCAFAFGSYQVFGVIGSLVAIIVLSVIGTTAFYHGNKKKEQIHWKTARRRWQEYSESNHDWDTAQKRKAISDSFFRNTILDNTVEFIRHNIAVAEEASDVFADVLTDAESEGLTNFISASKRLLDNDSEKLEWPEEDRLRGCMTKIILKESLTR